MKAQTLLPLTIHADTHAGLVHPKNEDSYAVVPTEDGGLLLVVCDGMGGMGKGDQASALAVATLTQSLSTGSGFPPDRLDRALQDADVRVREELCGKGEGLPGATAVVVYLLEGLAHVAWVGDSRAYLMREGAVTERTTDHKLVEELVAAGQLTAEEAKASALAHVVTRALGGRSIREAPVKVALLENPWTLRNGDKIVVCSDGVCDLIDDDEFPSLIADLEPDEAVERVIAEVLERGAHDNTTLILARWDGPDTPRDADEDTPVFAQRRAFEDEGAEDRPTERPSPEREVSPTFVDPPQPEGSPLDSQEPEADPVEPEAEAPATSSPAEVTAEEEGPAPWKIALAFAVALLLGLGAVFAVSTLFSMQAG